MNLKGIFCYIPNDTCLIELSLVYSLNYVMEDPII